jgi:3'-phosphoadenosine 5'-phosphosulfate sulfotransferase (PAPS reductase)/FAD synthetase
LPDGPEAPAAAEAALERTPGEARVTPLTLFNLAAPAHVVCFSGGHSSALVAVEVVRRYGKRDVVLLNHDIHERSEDADVKRFKRDVAAHLGLPITYANHPEWDTMDQFDVVRDAGAFKGANGHVLCTHYLKTAPFRAWLAANAGNASGNIMSAGSSTVITGNIDVNGNITISGGSVKWGQHGVRLRGAPAPRGDLALRALV